MQVLNFHFENNVMVANGIDDKFSGQENCRACKS